VKGVGLLDLIKVLKVYRRKHSLDGLRPETVEFLDEHLLASNWYPYELLMEIMRFTYERVLQEDDDATLQMGIAGARTALTTLHKIFIRPGDPMASALAMRQTWSAYFDFGTLHVEPQGTHAVRFTVEGYADIPKYHGILISAWHRSAPELAGATGISFEWRERPWLGDARMSYIVGF
jgi:hypothetical protein